MNKYDNKFMNSAIEWSTYSYCKRKQVGAVLVKDNREIASGYNGTISGSESNICEDYYYQCPYCKAKKDKIDDLVNYNKKPPGAYIDPFGDIIQMSCKNCKVIIADVDKALTYSIPEALRHTQTKDSVIHAERNIIAYCAKHGIAIDGCTMYITHSPCQGCAVLMAQSGITKVIYKTEYKDTTGIKILKDANIDISQYKG